MQISPRSTNLDLRVDHSAKSDTERRKIRRKHLRIADQRNVCLQLITVLANKASDSLPANLFFSFNNHAHIDRKLAPIGGKERFECLHMHPHLSLVVHSAACVQIAVALRRLK